MRRLVVPAFPEVRWSLRQRHNGVEGLLVAAAVQRLAVSAVETAGVRVEALAVAACSPVRSARERRS